MNSVLRSVLAGVVTIVCLVLLAKIAVAVLPDSDLLLFLVSALFIPALAFYFGGMVGGHSFLTVGVVLALVLTFATFYGVWAAYTSDSSLFPQIGSFGDFVEIAGAALSTFTVSVVALHYGIRRFATSAFRGQHAQ